MKTRRVAVGICVLLSFVPAEARADWTIRPFAGAAVHAAHGFVDLEQTAGDAKPVFGAAIAWQPRAIGFEFEVGVLPGFFEGPADLIVGGHLTTVMGNV